MKRFLKMPDTIIREHRACEVLWIVSVGDISKVTSDAIVCAANSAGLMRGGVSQALRIRGGDEIEKEARSRAPIRLGSAVATTAGRLNARWVIHAPTIRLPVETTTPKRIESAAAAAVRVASRLGARSIAFPGLGLGVGEVAIGDGAQAMVSGICQGLPSKHLITTVKIVVRRVEYVEFFSRSILQKL